MTRIGIQNISTWLLIFFDLVGVWLLVRPNDLVNLWTARRAPASDFDRFIARLVGVIALSMQIAHWVGQAKNTNAEPIMHWLSIIFWVGAVVFLVITSWVSSHPNPTEGGKWMKRGDASCSGIGGGIPSLAWDPLYIHLRLAMGFLAVPALRLCVQGNI